MISISLHEEESLGMEAQTPAMGLSALNLVLSAVSDDIPRNVQQ